MQKIELRCEICSLKFDSNYNVPKVLTCGHTVCSKCVDRMREKNLNKCPFDRKLLDFDDELIAINYYILSLIDNSVKDINILQLASEEENLELNPRPVINSPGWKNTIDGFIKNDILYTVETNGFIYCTDLKTGEWFFLYHNQFFGNFFFENINTDKKYLIDQYGSLFQIFNKNYYVQIGRKNAWKSTTHVTVFNDKMYSLESSNKFYETNLINGKWKEITIKKGKEREINNNNYFSKSGGTEMFKLNQMEDVSEIESRLFKNVNMLISTSKHILFTNKNGELYTFHESTGETKLIRKDYFKNIESYSANSTHVYFFEKNSKIIHRTLISIPELKKSHSNKYSSSEFEMDLKTHEEYCKSYLETEIYLNIENEPLSNPNKYSTNSKTIIVPIKVIANDSKLVIIDKIGDLYVFDVQTKKLINSFQCLFMLRNCHISNTALIGDGDLLLLDPIRLSLNKLNIIAGTEVIVLHSTKFLYSIKNIFSANSRIYFIDTSGNLYYFNEVDKKLTQIGNNSICKYMIDFAVHKNYLLTIENNTLYRTNLNDGNYIEIKNDYCKNYEYFFADNANVIFVTNNDEIFITTLNINTPNNKEKDNITNEGITKDQLKLKDMLKINKISKMNALSYFRNHLVYYDNDKKVVESINLEDKTHKTLIENFPEVNMFINNNDFLACISKDGVIYKLYC